MEEEKILIICPKCKTKTKIKKEGKPTRTVKCCNKECQYTGSLMQFGIAEAQPPKVAPQPSAYSPSCPTEIGVASHYAPPIPAEQPVPDDGGTMIERPPVGRDVPPAIGYLQVAIGEKYPLKIGANIVGRQHPTSQATIQIATNDGYMSRQHMRVDVIPASGNRMEYRISDNNSTNQLSINGQVLAQGDIVILRSGDRITIGHTDLIFKTV